MKKNDNFKIFIDEMYSSPPKKHYETNKKIYNQNDEKNSFDLADIFDYEVSSKKGFRYIFILISLNLNNFSKHTWFIQLKKKNTQKFFFSKLLKVQKVHKYPRLTDEGPSIVEDWVLRTIRNWYKKPVFEKRNADWICDLPSIIKQYKITFHYPKEMKPSDVSQKVNYKIVYFNLQDKKKDTELVFNQDIYFELLILKNFWVKMI